MEIKKKVGNGNCIKIGHITSLISIKSCTTKEHLFLSFSIVILPIFNLDFIIFKA